jgi:hypothetical protein
MWCKERIQSSCREPGTKRKRGKGERGREEDGLLYGKPGIDACRDFQCPFHTTDKGQQALLRDEALGLEGVTGK